MLDEFQNLCILVDKNLLDLIQIKKTSCEESHLSDLEKTGKFESLNVDNQNLLNKLKLDEETDKKLKLDEKLSKILYEELNKKSTKEWNKRFDRKLNDTPSKYINNLEKEPQKIYNVESNNESSIELIDDTESSIKIINENNIPKSQISKQIMIIK